MFDTICSLPQPSDVVCLALHPSTPILSVGLASGHLQTYRLPDSTSTTLTTTWRTRRHKGSCRSITYSTDGSTLFSCGTDGIVKACSAETGRVVAKIAADRQPSILHALSPQTLLLGTDGGHVSMYDVREDAPIFARTRPAQTLSPHYNPSDPDPDDHEPITSLTPLPATSASTSGYAKTWVTTAGSTVAVTDLRKGVVARSVNQADMLLSSCCVDAGAEQGQHVFVGGSLGFLTRWPRGKWEDQAERVYVGGRDVGLQGQEEPVGTTKTTKQAAAKRALRGEEDEQVTVDCLAGVPGEVGGGKGAWKGVVLAAGLGTGAVRFVRAGGGRVLGQCRHDETGVEGVAALGFDVLGRMVTGGGEVVKVWHPLGEEAGGDGESGSEEDEGDDEAESDESDDDTSSEEEEQEEKPIQPPPKRRKKGRGGDSGILRFEGL